MKQYIHNTTLLLIMLAILLPNAVTSASAAQTYPYTVMQIRDTSYATTKRIAYYICLNTESTPSHDSMKTTANQIWKKYGKHIDKFSIFITYRGLADVTTGAYGVANYTKKGLAEFFVNDWQIEMLALMKNKPKQHIAPPPALRSQHLQTGDRIVIKKPTPLMPEFKPKDILSAIKKTKRLPPGTMFTILQVKYKDDQPWYFGYANKKGSKIATGWINSGALLNQNI